MEELLNDFLAETADHLEQVGSQIVHFEKDPSNSSAIANIFRLVHTIKGTCGFLELQRLEKLAHAAETLISLVRAKGFADSAHVSLILTSLDRIRLILAALESDGREPAGEDEDLIAMLNAAAAEPPEDKAADYPVRSLPVAMERDTPAAEGPRAPGAGPEAKDSSRATAPAPAASMPAPASPPAAASAPQSREPMSIRVAIGTLERIMRLVSELVLTRNQLLEIARSHPDESLGAPLQRLSSVTSDLQDGVMHARMQPIERLFAPLPRLVRDLSRDLGKKAELVLEGADTELDRQLIDILRDPLTHLIRNCLDHGIETPAVRMAAGKPEQGTIKVVASHEAGHIAIKLSDDGRGLDIERIRAKVLALGLVGEEELPRIGNDELCRHIFSAGFSTAERVTNVSGRGVGMDVVRENIESIGGSVALSTSPGRGTTFTLKVPLTLAIAPALIFEVGGQRYAIAQHAVVEAVSCGEDGQSHLRIAQGVPMLELRDQFLPVADLRVVFGIDPQVVDRPSLAIVVRTGIATFALRVDNVADVQEIVVKPLDHTLSQLGLYAGSTLLGDGSVVLILNPNGLATRIGLDGTNQFKIDSTQQELQPEKKETSLILFRAGEGVLKALPLSLISRIESVASGDINFADGQLVVPHNGSLMPLVSLSAHNSSLDDLKLSSRPTWPVLVVGVGGEPMGLLVSEIVDIVDSHLEIDIAGVTPEIIGSTTIRGEPAEVLDLAHFMKAARPGAFERGHARRFRVMLVDDKLFFRDLLSPIISAAGYEVTAVASAAEGLAMLKRGINFDIVVSDVDMPDMDGYTFAKAIAELPRTREIPVIALDAHAGAAVLEAARQAGMLSVVGKFDRQGLLATLRGALDASAFTSSALEQKVSGGKAA